MNFFAMFLKNKCTIYKLVLEQMKLCSIVIWRVFLFIYSNNSNLFFVIPTKAG